MAPKDIWRTALESKTICETREAGVQALLQTPRRSRYHRFSHRVPHSDVCKFNSPSVGTVGDGAVGYCQEGRCECISYGGVVVGDLKRN